MSAGCIAGNSDNGRPKRIQKILKSAASWARRRRTGPRRGAQAPDVTPKLPPLRGGDGSQDGGELAGWPKAKGFSPVLLICVCAPFA
jgi:hypothetical protein